MSYKKLKILCVGGIFCPIFSSFCSTPERLDADNYDPTTEEFVWGHHYIPTSKKLGKQLLEMGPIKVYPLGVEFGSGAPTGGVGDTGPMDNPQQTRGERGSENSKGSPGAESKTKGS